MTPKYKYNIITSIVDDFTASLSELVAKVEVENCVRLVFFASIEGNEEYNLKFSQIETTLKALFQEKMPAFSLVAQAPLGLSLAIETCHIENDGFEIEFHNYGVVVKGDKYREIIAGGLRHDPINSSISEQSSVVFEKIGAILSAEKCAVENIVRQWNYIEGITFERDGEQNYQLFNDTRSEFYAKGDWSSVGYPAATGIGTVAGGIVIDFNAIVEGDECQIKALDNPLQIAAHDYTKNVLLGEKTQKTTPKFERAKAVCDSSSLLIYVSGTAAIRGESSLTLDAAQQTITTMENIDYLISAENQKRYSVALTRNVKCEYLRAYIKCPEDFEMVKSEMEKIAPATPIIYLYSDVCRDELLVEVEAIAY
ncbi:MAG: PTS cellobiose transporter subunit IIC [Rikenellaceae bacterium]